MKKILSLFILLSLIMLPACGRNIEKDAIEIVKNGYYSNEFTVGEVFEEMARAATEYDVDAKIEWHIENDSRIRNKLSDYIQDGYDQIVRTDMIVTSSSSNIVNEGNIYWVVDTSNKLFELVASNINKGGEDDFELLDEYEIESYWEGFGSFLY